MYDGTLISPTSTEAVIACRSIGTLVTTPQRKPQTSASGTRKLVGAACSAPCSKPLKPVRRTPNSGLERTVTAPTSKWRAIHRPESSFGARRGRDTNVTVASPT
jgi:hypothetical protein